VFSVAVLRGVVFCGVFMVLEVQVTIAVVIHPLDVFLGSYFVLSVSVVLCDI